MAIIIRSTGGCSKCQRSVVTREEVVAYLKRSECNSDVEIRGCFVQIIPYKKEVQSGRGQNRKIGPSTVALFLVERQGQEQIDRANMEDNGTYGSKIVEGEISLSVTKGVV